MNPSLNSQESMVKMTAWDFNCSASVSSANWTDSSRGELAIRDAASCGGTRRGERRPMRLAQTPLQKHAGGRLALLWS
jgi:hypothetical protein